MSIESRGGHGDPVWWCAVLAEDMNVVPSIQKVAHNLLQHWLQGICCPLVASLGSCIYRDRHNMIENKSQARQ